MMRPGWTIGLSLLALGAGLALSLDACRPAQARETAHVEPEDDLEGFWWLQVGEQSCAVANFGPLLETEQGPVRRWSLTIHLPGSGEPLSCVQGVTPADSVHPISARGESFAVELRPRAGMTWGELEHGEQVAAEILGLY